jgi:hypothetical protein
LPLDKLEGLKLANRVFQRAQNDTMVFPNDSEMLDVIENVRKESGITHWQSPFKDTKVLAALIGLLAAIVGLGAAIIKLVKG